MHVYEDGCYCFSCGFTCDIKDVLNEEEIRKFRKEKPEKEDLEETIRQIELLDMRKVRGLTLKSDSTGFYIIWPDRSFYKKRLAAGTSRYVGPRGHRPPLFKIERASKDLLIIVEGELNCLSLDLSLGDSGVSIVSPGSASGLQGYIDYYIKYKQIIIVMDKDPAGVVAGLELKKTLQLRRKSVKLIAVDPDFNETLQTLGPEAVKIQLLTELGLN